MRCYSSWHFPNDITHRIISAVASSIGYGKGPMRAVSGFYGVGNNNLFHTVYGVKPWVQYEFDTVVTITKIIIRTKHTSQGSFFDDIRVKFGNSSYVVSNSWNPLFVLGDFSPAASSGAIVVFKVDSTRTGKYLAFKYQKSDNHHVLIGDLKVIGY